MNMIEYKHYDKSYEDEVLKVFTESFVNYPLFWGVFENRFKSEVKLRSFYYRLMKGIFRATVRKDDCYIGIVDGNVAVIVIIEKLRDTLKFMEMSDKTEVVVKSIPEPRWHLYFLAVGPDYQKQGYGSGAIRDFVIPLVKSNSGNLLTVTTNAEKNVAFYINNGFKLVKEEMLECNAKTVGNWTFRMDL